MRPATGRHAKVRLSVLCDSKFSHTEAPNRRHRSRLPRCLSVCRSLEMTVMKEARALRAALSTARLGHLGGWRRGCAAPTTDHLASSNHLETTLKPSGPPPPRPLATLPRLRPCLLTRGQEGASARRPAGRPTDSPRHRPTVCVHRPSALRCPWLRHLGGRPPKRAAHASEETSLSGLRPGAEPGGFPSSSHSVLVHGTVTTPQPSPTSPGRKRPT